MTYTKSLEVALSGVLVAETCYHPSTYTESVELVSIVGRGRDQSVPEVVPQVSGDSHDVLLEAAIAQAKVSSAVLRNSVI